jgi:hypothetical protein
VATRRRRIKPTPIKVIEANNKLAKSGFENWWSPIASALAVAPDKINVTEAKIQ